MDALISAESLGHVIGPTGPVILDATWYLPQQARCAIEEFRAEHIPGAQFFDIDRIADQSSHLPHMLPTAPEFEAAVSPLGISNDTEIVVYDNNDFMASARVWWMFRTFGHRRIKVLNGGLQAWRQRGLSMELQQTIREPGSFQAAFRPELVKDFDQMLALVQAESTQIIDARPEARFRGEAPEPRPGLRSGHIPGSHNLFFKELIDSDTHTLLPQSQLLEAYANRNLHLDAPIVMTCGSGVTAAVLALSLAALGYPDIPIYDGSWSEWGREGNHPIAIG